GERPDHEPAGPRQDRRRDQPQPGARVHGRRPLACAAPRQMRRRAGRRQDLARGDRRLDHRGDPRIAAATGGAGLSAGGRTGEATTTGTPRLETEGALVTANHHLAARAGASMFGLGGNAMDAAAATAFAAGVVEPAMSGIGGRGYIVVLPAGSCE